MVQQVHQLHWVINTDNRYIETIKKTNNLNAYEQPRKGTKELL